MEKTRNWETGKNEMETTWERPNQLNQEEAHSIESSLSTKNEKAQARNWTLALGSTLNTLAVIGISLGAFLFVDLAFNYGQLSTESLLFLSENLGSGRRNLP